LLRQAFLEAGIQYARSICVRDEGGHSDNLYTAAGIGSKGPNFTQQLEAVHSRHFNVAKSGRLFFVASRPSTPFLANTTFAPI
jgi:hypothetical protein